MGRRVADIKQRLRWLPPLHGTEVANPLCLALILMLATPVMNRAATLWLSTSGATSATGPSPTNWNASQVVSFDQPGLRFGSNATDGAFKVVFGFNPPQPVRELYCVNTTIRVGNPGSDFELWPGDLLVVFNVSTPTNFGPVINVLRDDVLLYRPGPDRDYTNGTYFMLLDNPINDGGVRNVHALTLVEQDTRVGQTLIPKGTFLVARSDTAKHMNIYTYRPTSVGPGTTSPSAGQFLLSGAKLGFDSPQVQGLDLLEWPVSLGSTHLKAGLLLVSLNDATTLNPTTQKLPVQPTDIFALDVTATEQDPVPDTRATAAMLFDGSNVGLDDTLSSEELISFTLAESALSGPMITTQPQSQAVGAGSTVAFRATASSAAPLFWQWRFNDHDLPGATNATLLLPNVQYADTGAYSVRVSNPLGSTNSTPALLTVLVPQLPGILNQPADATVVQGSNAIFSVTVSGTPVFSFQWCFNGAPLPGATNSTLALTDLASAQSGVYSVVVSNSAGVATSRVARLLVVVPPAIVTPPASRVAVQGETVVLDVVATDPAPLLYQWRFNGTHLAGATNATLTLANVQPAQAGKYSVQVRNPGASVTSSEATLTVLVPPTITDHPDSKDLNLSSPVTLTVRASGTTPFSYQWLKDGVAIAGANSASLALSQMTRELVGAYEVIVANPAGYAISQPAILRVNAAPQITVQPVSQTVSRGTNAVFSVTATGLPAPTYQWRLNGVNLAGATSPTLVLTNVQPKDCGKYTVVVQNALGTVNSAVAQLTVDVPWLPFADMFTNRGIIYTAAGAGRGTNLLATKESGEKDHSGRGSAETSVWLSWWAPANGVATFSTAGSDFDTVMAVYQGSSLSSLVKLTSNDDGAPFHCSQVTFNAQAGTYYQIAVSGHGRARGQIMLTWNLEVTTELLPEIVQAPQSYTGNTNNRVVLEVVFTAFEPTAIQWFYAGQVIPGATTSAILIERLQPEYVGGYAVRLTAASGRTVVSPPGDIQINTEGAHSAAAQNKFADALDTTLQQTLPARQARAVKGTEGGAAPSRGYTGTQVFSTLGADKEEGEPEHCGVPGGASEWFFYQAAVNGVLLLDTEGSSFDTVLAVYTGAGADFASLVPVGCDDNSGSNGQWSKVMVNATAGTLYCIAVDGVYGASGTVQLNYALIEPPIILTQPQSQTVSAGGAVQLNVTASGGPELQYQWSFNGADLPGATEPSFALPSFQQSQAGQYQARVSNVAGSALSLAAQLRLDAPLRLSQCSRLTNGCFRIRLAGLASATYVMQASTNLIHWAAVATNTPANGQWDFEDAQAGTRPRCYYRLIQLP